nr:Tn3 family transposase [Kitasatospora acidiphila]
MSSVKTSVPVRAVVGSRVSDTHGDEGKVSHLVQAESATRHALTQDWEAVGSVEDLDVSAVITPWKRPGLGPWLTDRQGEWDGMEDQIGAPGLVLDALVLCNTRSMEAAVKRLRMDGFDVRDEDVARLSPFVRHHVNMLGRYSFQLLDLPGGLRPLRDPDAAEA